MHTTSTVMSHAFRADMRVATTGTAAQPSRSIRARFAAAVQRRTGPADAAVAVPRREQPVPFC